MTQHPVPLQFEQPPLDYCPRCGGWYPPTHRH
jgi:hypothetical protein